MAKPRREPPYVTMSVRAVVASDEAFVSRGISFSDFGVAMDEISALRPSGEPLVLRVTATGGRASERSELSGDWLCPADGSQPEKIGRPHWPYSDEALRWSRGRTWLAAWETCRNARWMISAASSVGADKRLVALAACACARDVARYAGRRMAAVDLSPIRVVEAWAEGRGDALAVRATAQRAATRAVHEYDEADAIAVLTTDTYAAAWGTDGDSRPSGEELDEYYARTFACAVYEQFEGAFPSRSAHAFPSRSDIVRRHVPTFEVLRASVGDDEDFFDGIVRGCGENRGRRADRE